MKFNFSNLEPIEFENLCKDLINDIEDKEFKIYAQGKDGGIDFKWEESSTKIIGQAKHYLNSNKSNLITAVKKEKEKIEKIKPDKYIFMTSYNTTPAIEDEIFEILTPYLISKNDIYGLARIDDLLESHKEVLYKNYNLWLTNIEILEELRDKAKNQDIEIEIEKILEKKDLYVQTSLYKKAIKILENKNFLLITGEPGVGKTSLAEMLVLKYLDSNYKLKFVVSQEVSDLKQILSPNKEDKEVIFIDDFLGSNYLKYFQGNDEGGALIKFFQNTKYYKNKRIILTSRITILNKAYQCSEKFNREKKENYHIKITDYNRKIKARILLNHLKYFKLDQKYIDELLRDKNYRKIIEHSNYYPRLIEFICKSINYNSKIYKNYFEFVMDSLNTPNEIWKMAFNNNLKDRDRYLLRVLFSFNGKASKDKLKKAYEERLIKENIQVETDSFELILSHLVDGFIKVLLENKVREITFLNPSIMDFMLDRYRENETEILHALKFSKYEKQIIFLLNQTLKKEKNLEFLEILVNKIENIEFENIESKLKFLGNIFCKKYQKILEEEIGKIIKFIITKKISLEYLNIYDFVGSIYDSKSLSNFMFKSKYSDKTSFSNPLKKEILDFLKKETNTIEKLVIQIKNEYDLDIFYKLIFQDIKVSNFEEKLDVFENKIKKILEDKYADLELQEKAYDLVYEEYNIEGDYNFEKMEESLKDDIKEEVENLKNSFKDFLRYVDIDDEQYIENYLYETEDVINDSLEQSIENTMSEIWIDWEEAKENVEEDIKEEQRLDLEDFSGNNAIDDWEQIDLMFECLNN